MATDQNEVLLKRHEALKARNRKAQKRYRAKKTEEVSHFKQMAEDLSLDLALISAQADELRQEKQALQTQLAALNSVTGVRLLPGAPTDFLHRGSGSDCGATGEVSMGFRHHA